jgi:hypothetical protein
MGHVYDGALAAPDLTSSFGPLSSGRHDRSWANAGGIRESILPISRQIVIVREQHGHRG